MITYTTKDGDVLDDICYIYYGHLTGTVEKVMQANYRLSQYGPILPAGIKIILPEIKIKSSKDIVRMWE